LTTTFKVDAPGRISTGGHSAFGIGGGGFDADWLTSEIDPVVSSSEGSITLEEGLQLKVRAALVNSAARHHQEQFVPLPSIISNSVIKIYNNTLMR
jgi:hypothetical protein